MADNNDVTFLHEIPVDLVVELGRARLTIGELAELGRFPLAPRRAPQPPGHKSTLFFFPVRA